VFFEKRTGFGKVPPLGMRMRAARENHPEKRMSKDVRRPKPAYEAAKEAAKSVWIIARSDRTAAQPHQ
jgi:hypothetical protein